LNLTWSQPNRVLIHIADAPAHGAFFHEAAIYDDEVHLTETSGAKDGENNKLMDPLAMTSSAAGPGTGTPKDRDPEGKRMLGLLQKIKSLEISYFFGKILEDTDMGSI
jgi:hypothetical protein